MAELLRERLARTELPGPVRTVRLRSGPLRQAREEAGDLFARDRGAAAEVPQFVERLRARLGADELLVVVDRRHQVLEGPQVADVAQGEGAGPAHRVPHLWVPFRALTSGTL